MLAAERKRNERIIAANHLIDKYGYWVSAHDHEDALLLWFEASSMPNKQLYIPFNLKFIGNEVYYIYIVRDEPNTGVFSLKRYV